MAVPGLIDDWRRILKHAWSVRLIALSILLSAVEVAVQAAIAIGYQPPILPGAFAVLAGIVSGAAGFARFVAQPKMRGE